MDRFNENETRTTIEGRTNLTLHETLENGSKDGLWVFSASGTVAPYSYTVEVTESHRALTIIVKEVNVKQILTKEVV